MSYNKFLDEQCEQIRLLYDEEERSTGSRTVSTERHWELFHLAHGKVFARWVADERFSELISYFHSNYDSGQGDEFLYPLSEVLVAKKRVREVGRLPLPPTGLERGLRDAQRYPGVSIFYFFFSQFCRGP